MLVRKTGWQRWMVSLVLTWVIAVPGSAALAADEAIEEIVGVLRSQGLIDEETSERILAKHYREQERSSQSAVAAALDGFEWYGDLRLRNDHIWYDGSFTGQKDDDRNRLRYRFRFGFKKKVNDWATVVVRLASNSGSNIRSTNVSFGENDDFAPDDIYLDRVYADLTLPRAGPFTTRLLAGKVGNPFHWKNGKDLIVMDPDFNPEGVYALTSAPLGESGTIWGKLGYFVVDEESSTSDPKLWALQLGGESRVNESLEVGARATAFEWRSLDSAFISRNVGQGNLTSAFDSQARILETSMFAKIGLCERWPLLAYGTYVTNVTADSAVIAGIPVGEENDGFMAGFEIGSSKQLFKFGLGYARVEANAVPAQFTDSDFFDGHTNREGWIVYGARKLSPHTEFKITLFEGEEIKNTGSSGGSGPFNISPSVDAEADRKRLQTDLVFTF